MFFRVCLLFVILFTISPTVSAQPARPVEDAIEGRVVDPAGLPIAGAAVRVRDARGERVVWTDPEGGFSLARADGDVRLTVTAPNFAPARRAVAPDGGRRLEIVLEPAPQVEHVTVLSASRQLELRETLNVSVDVVPASRLRESADSTVAEVLRDLPGVVTRRGSEASGAAGEQIHGIDSRQVLVLVDGQPVVGARGIKSGVLNLDRQATGRLGRVEVVKGAASSLFGSDAIGGVINLITREVERPVEIGARVSGGTLGQTDMQGTGGLRAGAWSVLASATGRRRGGFDLTPGTFDTTGAEFRRSSGFGKAQFRATPALLLGATVDASFNRETGRSIGELGPQENDVRDRSAALHATADLQLGHRAVLQARWYDAGYHEDSEGRLAPPDGTRLEPATLDERLRKADASISGLFGSRHWIQAGAEWWSDRYTGADRIADPAGRDAETWVLWGQERLTAGPATFTVGARWDHHSAFGSAVSPKAAVNLRAADALRLRASYGAGFRAPDLGQLYYRFLNPTNLYQVIGNPNLEPERSHSWQAGADYAPRSGRWRLGGGWFRNEVDDLIESVSLGFVASPAQLAAIMQREGLDPALFRPQLNRLLFIYRNLAHVRTEGAEFDGEVALARGLRAGAAYTLLDARDEETGARLTNRHRHQGSVRLQWEDGPFGVRGAVRGMFASSWLATAGRGTSAAATAPGFALWDLYLAKRLPRGLDMFLQVDNVIDSRDPNAGRLDASGVALPIYRPEYGRTWQAGLRWNLHR